MRKQLNFLIKLVLEKQGPVDLPMYTVITNLPYTRMQYSKNIDKRWRKTIRYDGRIKSKR